jgi:hypothetical protein
MALVSLFFLSPGNRDDLEAFNSSSVILIVKTLLDHLPLFPTGFSLIFYPSVLYHICNIWWNPSLNFLQEFELLLFDLFFFFFFFPITHYSSPCLGTLSSLGKKRCSLIYESL